MSTTEFREFMTAQRNTIVAWVAEHAETEVDKDRLAIEWITKNAKAFRESWEASHNLVAA